MKLSDSLRDNNSVRLQAEADNWQQAIKIGTDLLVGAGVVLPEYYEAILAGVRRFGPYFLLTPGLAMPHARPEEGVLRNGFALVTLKTPVCFGDKDNDPIDILVTLAACDARTHQEEGIRQIVQLFENPENFQKIRDCRHPQQVLELINQSSLPTGH